jgi:hypothetical protein
MPLLLDIGAPISGGTIRLARLDLDCAMMPKRSYKQIPIDPSLRERALQIVELYRTRSKVPASDSAADQMAALVPSAMKTIKELVHDYDGGELSLATQTQLISTLKKIVRKYEGLHS